VAVIAGGRVVRVRGGDTLPVPGARVVMHRVGRAEQGPVDSTLADARGRFRFRFTADTSAIYLFSSRHDGIAYFASPVHTNPERPDTAIDLVVSDTSSHGRVTMAARHIVVSAPDEHGTRAVVEVIVLHNGETTALVARDSTEPVWAVPIPPAATGLAAGEGDFAPESIVRTGDRAALYAPVAPGDKQVVLQYAIPEDLGSVPYRFAEPVPLVNVMLEEKAARVDGGLTAQPDSQTIQGRGFARWEGAVAAGTVITLRLPHRARLGRWALAALVAALAAGLLLGLRPVFSRSPARVAETPASLIDAIARLDARHAARAPDDPGVDDAGYLAERSALKARLAAALARSGDVP